MTARFRHILLTLLVAISLGATGMARAQTETPSRPFKAIQATWERVLDNAEREVARVGLTQERAAVIRKAVRQIREDAEKIKLEAQEEVESLTQLAEALGPPPADGEGEEAPEVAKKRQQFSDDIAVLKGRVSQAELAATRAAALDQALATAARRQLFERLQERTPLPLDPSALAVAGPEFIALLEKLWRAPAEAYAALAPEVKARPLFWRLATIAFVAAFLGWLVRRLLLLRFGRKPEIADPSYARRFTAAIAEGVARGIVPGLILLVFFFRLEGPDTVWSGLFVRVASSFVLALFFLVMTIALTRAALAPDLPAWALTDLAPANARLINRRIVFLGAVAAVDFFLVRSTATLGISPELTAVYSQVATALEGLGMLLLLQGRLWQAAPVEVEGAPPEEPPAEEAPAQFSVWVLVRRLIGLVVVAGISSVTVGYALIGGHLIRSLLITAVVFGALYLARGMLRELIGALTRSSFMRDFLALRHHSRDLIKLWCRALLDPLLLFAGFVAVAPAWGIARDDLFGTLSSLARGFEVGGVRISLTELLAALVIFVLGIALTRLIQRGLRDRVFPETNLDPGVRHSLVAGLGYLGFILAAVAAIGTLGLDLNKIALVAGALSVGIGFGLQNVVNNFISGVILLVERPIKVGDWVVVGANEGFVKRITVRATEIETFQYASVIIPNAELISNSVTNWTHKDRYGRIEVRVGVAYGSDTERVRDILLACADEHPKLLKRPAPNVLFSDFGNSSLDFELRCYTGNVVERLFIASDLRFRIDTRFREEGIEIPFPQRVVHLARGAAEASGEVRPSEGA